LALAKNRIKKDPARYVNKIYGELEVGGSSWLYVSGVSFDQLKFQDLPSTPPPKLTETIQDSLFSYLWSPVALFAVLGGIMRLTHRHEGDTSTTHKGGE
jgi:hypothetical protein